MQKRFEILLTLLVMFTPSLMAEEMQIKPTREIVYKTIDDVELQLHVFEPKVASDKKRTAIVYFFGGGWSVGTPKQFYQQAHEMAELGVLGIAAEYRVKSKHKTSPFISVEDAKSAIRWVRENAELLNVDPDKVIASGGSAGGHLAVCTGLIVGLEAIDEDSKVSSVPNAIIAYNPVLDTTKSGYGLEKVGKDRSTEISPCHQVRKGIVPTLVLHGTADSTVPFENAERFVKLMKEAGNDCELKAYEGKKHGFFNSKFFRPKILDLTLYKKTSKESVDFLKRLGYIEEK